MKTIYRYNGKKISKAKAVELAGKERFAKMLKEAKEAFAEDPNQDSSYMVAGGMLNFWFE